MITHLEKALVALYMEEKSFRDVDAGAINLAIHRLSQSDYFQGNFASWKFLRRSDDYVGLYQETSRGLASISPLDSMFGDADDYRDEGFNDTPSEPWPRVPKSRGPSDNPMDESECSSALRARADHYLEALWRTRPDWAWLKHPQPADVLRRQDLKITVLAGKQALAEKLEEILSGPLVSSVRRLGIEYHEPLSWGDRSDWRYVVAHNAMEVAGIAGVFQKEDQWIVSYVSVAPGFRNRGVSLRMYQKILDLCVSDQKMLVRSSPGKFTQEHPEITAAYDRMVMEQPVLHGYSGYLSFALEEALKRLPYEQVLTAGKAACDDLLKTHRGPSDSLSHGYGCSEDRAIALRLRDHLKDAVAPAQTKRKQSRRTP